MMAAAALATEPKPLHIPVLLRPLLAAVAPVLGLWIDGTFGAGGYSEGLLQAGATQVVGIDRDPSAITAAAAMQARWGDALRLVQGPFSELDTCVSEPADGVVLDLGVSSMQLDRSERGFSFLKDGPLDMRMAQSGPSAADLVNNLDEAELADILFQLGEERASRRIARAIVEARAGLLFETTHQLSEVIETCLPRTKPGQSHPATRSFQAIRIAVNDEFGELIAGLEAAERALKPGGKLAVVSFHSLEDRIVKRFLQTRSSGGGGGSRHAPEVAGAQATFSRLSKAIAADTDELTVNPRARSAKLRVAQRTDAPAGPVDRSGLGLPGYARKKETRS